MFRSGIEQSCLQPGPEHVLFALLPLQVGVGLDQVLQGLAQVGGGHPSLEHNHDLKKGNQIFKLTFTGSCS